MEYIKLTAIIFGASGLWKIIELLVKSRIERRKDKAEVKHLHAQAEAQIVGNWIQWSQHLEQRVRELETVAQENQKLTIMVQTQKEMIEAQRKRIIELENKVTSLQKENEGLHKEIASLKTNKV